MITVNIELDENIKKLNLIESIVIKNLLGKINLNTLAEGWRTCQLIKILYKNHENTEEKLYVCPYCGWSGVLYGMMTHHITLCNQKYNWGSDKGELWLGHGDKFSQARQRRQNGLKF